MKTFFRYVLGIITGITIEYLCEVELNKWIIITLICLTLLIVIDIFDTKK